MFRALTRLPAEALSDDAFRVAMALAWFTDSEGLCYPSLTKLGKKCGLKHRMSVVRGLRQLEDLGVIVKLLRGHADRDRVKDRKKRGGFQATNYYQLLWVNPVSQLTDSDTTTVQRMPIAGGVPVSPSAAAQGGNTGLPPEPQAGGNKSGPEVVTNRGSSHCSLPSQLNSAPDGALDSKWQGILRDLAHEHLSALPPLSGLDLADAVKADAQQFSIAASLTDDHIGAAIEQALQQRRTAASMSRPHHHQKRRRA